ncbi:hypothetical protein OUZ56_026344 [Daphnia magna]|uniref:Uncharacterized protein n=1 Tax=Daphnia magna TaxID=35525 RepID=A0ABQ9ZLJ8_9CRUS|nr:hypothetical protein OUZ56_026344 [Daphnia magna]
MSEAVAKAESIESGGKISIEDEMKLEAVKNEGPLLPDNDLKQKHVRRNAAHTKLTNQLRKAVADHKMGAIRLKKLQVAAWRDEFIRIFEDVKDLHHKYMESLPDITDINVKHVKNGRFNLTPTTWKSSTSPLVSSIGTSASDVTISTTLSQKRSTRSAPTDLPRQTSQLDLHNQKQMLELEVKLEQSKFQMEANATSVTETLSKALKGMGEQLGQLIDSSHVTSTEIAANTQLVKDSR